MFGTSRKTISRRIKAYNLREEVLKYDDLSDEASDEAMSAVLRNQDPDHFGIWMAITS